MLCVMLSSRQADRCSTVFVNGVKRRFRLGAIKPDNPGDQRVIYHVRSETKFSHEKSRLLTQIAANWTRIKEIANENSFFMNYVDFYGHSDPDMLEVGNDPLTIEENRSHFALWAIMKSPLLIGTDLTKLGQVYIDILKNKYLLAFNQDDVTGKPAAPYKWGTNEMWTFDPAHPAEYWSGTFKQGTLVAALNVEDTVQQKDIWWKEVPQLQNGNSYNVVDAWTDQELGCHKDGIALNVAAHDIAVLVVTGEC